MFRNSAANLTSNKEEENFLKVTEVNKRDNWLELKVLIEDFANGMSSRESVHSINTSISICIKVLYANITDLPLPPKQCQQNSLFSRVYDAPDQNVTGKKIFLLFKFVKNDSDDDAIYSITCNSIGLGILNKAYCTDNDSWYLVHETTVKSNLSFNIILSARIIKSENPFKALYEDTELADFKLIGEGGSEVKIHGAVLAAQNPTMLKMIQEKTIKDNVIEYTGVKENTLQDFKAYIYLYVLPSENIEQLLLLASKAMMPELERKCIQKIMTTLTATNIYQVTAFAQQHKIHELFLCILEYIQKGKVKVTDVRSYLKFTNM